MFSINFTISTFTASPPKNIIHTHAMFIPLSFGCILKKNKLFHSLLKMYLNTDLHHRVTWMCECGLLTFHSNSKAIFNSTVVHCTPTHNHIRRCQHLFLSCVYCEMHILCVCLLNMTLIEEGMEEKERGREGWSISKEITHPLSLVFIRSLSRLHIAYHT